MDFRHLLPLVIIGGSFTFVGAILYGSWLLGRYKGREDRAPGELIDVEIRLERLEATMVQLGNSLDRLEAAHRLTARMLSETPNAAVAAPRRSITPH